MFFSKMKPFFKLFKKILKRQGYVVSRVNHQKNSVNGLLKKEGEVYFFKLLDKEYLKRELVGFFSLKDVFPIPNLVEIIEFADYGCAVFSYEKTIQKDKGLLLDFIVDEELKKVKPIDLYKFINPIFNLYKQSLKKVSIRQHYPSNLFFKGRIESRLLKWYQKSPLMDFHICVNNTNGVSTNYLINKIINYYKVNHKYCCFQSQGDPTCLNIEIKPVFFDYCTAGYNAILAEISTFFLSILCLDFYLAPKYHPSSYYNHKKVFKLKNTTPAKIIYRVNQKDKIINIFGGLQLSKVRQDILLNYLDIFSPEIISSDIFYFIAMRCLCVFNLEKMSKMDKIYILFLLHLIYNLLEKENENTLKKLKLLISEAEIV